MPLILPNESPEDKKTRAIQKLKEDLMKLQDYMADEILEDQISPSKMQQLTANFGFLASVYECLKHDLSREEENG